MRTPMTLLGTALALYAQALHGQTAAARATVQRIVADQVTSELLGTDLSLSRLPSTLSATPDQSILPGITIWRVRVPSTDYWHSYFLAWDGRQWLRLGGFPAPELVALSRILRHRHANQRSILDEARHLAVLGDPDGGDIAVFPYAQSAPATDSITLAEWSISGLAVAPDTVFQRVDRGYSALITVLTRPTRDVPRPWLSNTYGFQFDHDGTLVGWSRLRSQPLVPK